MDMLLYDRLGECDEHRHFRASFLQSAFCRQTTMQDILDDPDDALDALSTIRGVGETSMSRLRQFLVREFSTLFPEDWQAANAALASETPPETPRAQALARFIISWDVVAEFLPIAGRFYPDYAHHGTNRVMVDSLVRGEQFVYACESFPEILKTPEVLVAEQGQDAIKASYIQHLSGLRAHLPPLTPGSLVIMNETALSDLLTGNGDYKHLSEAARHAQIQVFRAFSAALPDLDAYVARYREIGLSSGFMSGEGPLLHYCFGGYIEITSPDMMQVFQDRVALVRKHGQPLIDWIEAHTDKTGGMG